MREEKIPMGQRELHRWHLMKMAEVSKIPLKEELEKIGVPCCEEKRIRRAIRGRRIDYF